MSEDILRYPDDEKLRLKNPQYKIKNIDNINNISNKMYKHCKILLKTFYKNLYDLENSNNDNNKNYFKKNNTLIDSKKFKLKKKN